jgi:hypothetical protein
MDATIELLQQYAGALVAVAAMLTALKIITGAGPFKWVWDRLIHQPVRESLREVINAEVSPLLESVRAELTTNGGSSLRDAINRLEKQGARLEDGLAEAKATAAEVRHELEASILAAQNRLPDA